MNMTAQQISKELKDRANDPKVDCSDQRWMIKLADAIDALPQPQPILSHLAPHCAVNQKVEALTHAIYVCDSKNLSMKNAGYRAACDEIKVSLLAAIERTLAGDTMISTAVTTSAEAVQTQVKAKPEIPRVLFDGNTVFKQIGNDPRAAARTSAENVSDVLDAVVAIMRKGNQ